MCAVVQLYICDIMQESCVHEQFKWTTESIHFLAHNYNNSTHIDISAHSVGLLRQIVFHCQPDVVT